MIRAQRFRRSAAALGALGLLALSAQADELFYASPTTLIAQGDPYGGSFNIIGACGGAAHSMTLAGDVLWLGDPLGRIYKKAPGDPGFSFIFSVPNNARALAMHAGHLLSGGGNSVVRVDLGTGAVLGTLNVPVPVAAMVVTGDDVYIASSSAGLVFKGHALTGGFTFFGNCGAPASSLAIDSTHLILGTNLGDPNSGEVYRLNLTTHVTDASFTVGSDAAAMVVHLGDLLIGGSNSTIRRVQRFSGAVKQTFTTSVPVSALGVKLTADPGSIYCYGTACPCGNNDPEAGCANSTGFGARLAGTGTASVSADDLAIHAFQMPAKKAGRFYMSSTISQLPFGGGFLCTGGGGYPTFRFPAANSGLSGSIAMPPNIVNWCANNLPPSGLIHPGSTWHFQAWYRDPLGPCASFNTTDALSVTFLP